MSSFVKAKNNNEILIIRTATILHFVAKYFTKKKTEKVQCVGPHTQFWRSTNNGLARSLLSFSGS